MSESKIVALITIEPDKVSSASVPVFFENSLEDAEQTARILARITRGVVHSLNNGVLVISGTQENR